MPFIIFFNYKPLGIGSFYSYSVIAYCILIVIEFLLKKDKSIEDAANIKRLLLIAIRLKKIKASRTNIFWRSKE